MLFMYLNMLVKYPIIYRFFLRVFVVLFYRIGYIYMVTFIPIEHY